MDKRETAKFLFGLIDFNCQFLGLWGALFIFGVHWPLLDARWSPTQGGTQGAHRMTTHVMGNNTLVHQEIHFIMSSVNLKVNVVDMANTKTMQVRSPLSIKTSQIRCM
jgi:hypothetical protein